MSKIRKPHSFEMADSGSESIIKEPHAKADGRVIAGP